MPSASQSDAQPGPEPTIDTAESRVAQLSDLLGQLEEGPPADRTRRAIDLERPLDNQLVEVRLGIASSLYRALRCKHEPTAKHSLRVTLACSGWSSRLGLSEAEHDQLELAALLHDVGKLGVPDDILTKPGSLTQQEASVMNSHWPMGLEILRCSCASQGVLDIIAATPTWYDGSRAAVGRSGKPPPVGSRMLAIADAFDAMLADHVYRRAFTRERAFHELYRCAGTQFDPELVKRFIEDQDCDTNTLCESVARRWLRDLEPEATELAWRLADVAQVADAGSFEALFQRKLLANMFDAVLFVDSSLRIIQWNRGAERLTGITEASVQHRRWLPSLLELRDERGEVIRDEDCPLSYAIRTGVQWLRRLSVRSRTGRQVAVDAHAVPVVGADGVARGLALVLHDASSEISLEARCENLNQKASKDPLTQLGNRAEFDRAHSQFVTAYHENALPCSLIICDIDRFKHVNDTYGHQAGDDVILNVARLLKSACQPGDLAARYGGEEFVLLFADSNCARAVRRAEELRLAFGRIPQPALGGKSVTISFGVTEIQPGDTPETMLRRADRALMNAKQAGRNRVVQLGSGNELTGSTGVVDRAGRRASRDALFECHLVSEAPLSVCIEKLRGFVGDHHAEVESVDGDRIRLRFGDPGGWSLRRMTDRPLRLVMDLEFEEFAREQQPREGVGRLGAPRTKIHMIVTPQKQRDRRRKQLAERARHLVESFRSYLMATEAESARDGGVFNKAKGLLSNWFRKQ
ncbi:MAG TPA: diguanylate cyclase [Pirellulales bacterium]|nr:diguanylate cyclase [Pirellulales bacterium]